MIPRGAHREVTSTMTGESNPFTIAVTGNAFKVWTDKLYTNKERAPIRELWTNAFDSHVEAGIPDTPFYCQLPTLLAPTFVVRDYGVSMTHDEVMHLYTTLFESSKTGTNEQVGHLGLGSKSPFAYIDAFYVTAYLDGERRVYLAALDERGIPTITHTLSEPSDEPTGLEVSFAVRATDFAKFEREANEVALGFDVVPTISGGEIKVPTPSISGAGWRVYDQSSGSSQIKFGVRQGCVIYPVTADQLAITTPLRWGSMMIVDVPIGSVEVAPSREALSLDKDTIATVQAAFAAASTTIIADAIAHVKEADSLLEAEKRYSETRQFLKNPPVVSRGTIKLSGHIRFKQGRTTPELIDYKGHAVGTTPTFPVGWIPNLIFIVDRGEVIPRRAMRVRKFRDTRSSGTSSSMFIVKNPTPQQLAKLVKRLGLRRDQVISITSLPDPGPTTRAAREAKRPANYARAGVYTTGLKSLEHQGKDPEPNFIYLGVDRADHRYVTVDDVGSFHSSHLRDAIKAVTTQLNITRPVYVMIKGAQNRHKVDEKDSLVTHIKAWLVTNEKKIVADQVATATRLALQQESSIGLSQRVLNELCPPPKSGPPSDLIRRLLPPGWLATANEEGRVAAADIEARYPLLFNLDDDTICQYISQGGELL